MLKFTIFNILTSRSFFTKTGITLKKRADKLKKKQLTPTNTDDYEFRKNKS
ncbi:hypothetical protein HJ01_00402 [Flavobacterium frigoris PS1]|uniref:Uncharacterized protein n=1 Tax=Flavobacterium frigoris (strain PS1) TaxID=1086011 RepID=H7FMD3_FLAFP|nr:hypothetical protein HJ01_00402 [Flavobacterium frigoris PS1]